jgi:excinuclease ABC subunit A
LDDREPVGESAGAIAVYGAREHNLKNISLRIPRDRFVVVTGVSGSGKSTLAFDLLFAEGQRRFLDSMNLYARQFVEQMSRPEVDLIDGIPPTVSIEQRTSRGGGKSTVATVTEVYHFFRLLFARLGVQHCPDCQVEVQARTRDDVARQLRKDSRKGPLTLLAPVVRNRKGFHTDVASWAAHKGYARIRADGEILPAAERLRLDRFREHDIEIVTGQLTGTGKATRIEAEDDAGQRGRKNVAKALATPQQLVDETLDLGGGVLYALTEAGEVAVYSTERVCPRCRKSFEPLDPKQFSYNSARGWCERCRGFGELFYLPDVDRGARADAIEESWYEWQEGKREVCPECQGSRLNPTARAVHLHLGGAARGKRIPDLTLDTLAGMPVETALEVFSRAKLTGRAGLIARDILPEIRSRLKFLDEVGLGYLQLGRGVPTLSGGESQRIRLAAQLGSNLAGVLYILDEPTIGLHARDNDQLLAALETLKSRGNSVLVVEHDEETMRRADYIIDLGPGAGIQGGEVVATGTLEELLKHPGSITGKCLSAHKSYPSGGPRRKVTEHPGRPGKRGSRSLPPPAATRWLTLAKATRNNLKEVTVHFPLGRLVLVTGVSGSGKSTLVRECLLPSLREALARRKRHAGASAALPGADFLRAVYEVDQSPIGRTPRSIPATYVGFFDDIRQLYAQVPEARLRGYQPSRFSFNSEQGRCPGCQGAGNVKLEMNFLPPAFVRCEVCGGTRFNRETLDIEYRGKNIAQVLDLSVAEALEFFASFPKIKNPLQALADTGLNYLKLGQTSPTLSGGEAQRVKLVTHLLAGFQGRDPEHGPAKWNLFILEEPTFGLHMADVKRLVEVLQRLVNAGHSVVVIEHNLELIAEADWVIDLGPEGGEGGGRIVAEGTPEQLATNKRSHTGRYLRKILQ